MFKLRDITSDCFTSNCFFLGGTSNNHTYNVNVYPCESLLLEFPTNINLKYIVELLFFFTFKNPFTVLFF